MTPAVRTTCPYCGVGCGIRVEFDGERPRIAGDEAHPANHGRLCSKGAALADTLTLPGRLLRPKVLGREVAWDAALEHVAGGFRRIIDAHGPDAVAFYVSGQLLTEDYYVANKLMKGYIGAANIDTNSRLCMSSAVVAHKRAFGEDVVPVGYEDLLAADLIVLVGSNLAWCHPVLYQRIAAEKERRPALKVVVVDPRRTPTCELADLHLPVAAGTDVWLFNGLLHALHLGGAADAAFLARHTAGAEQALRAAEESSADPGTVAARCGLELDALRRFYAWFAATERVVTAFSQGVNQSSSGVDKANAVINCHLYTGRIGRPGCGPLSITGQPNAMGGREVGGMATLLAAHRELANEAHRREVRAFWDSPRIADRPGLMAVELFEAVRAGRVRALWIAGTNPVVSLPDADRVRAALERCELVVVSDCVEDTDTNAYAHVLLPAAAWAEKDGTVTNTERCVSRQRRFLAPPGEARPDWWMFCEVAKRMGFERGFEYASPREIFLEHARLAAAGAGSGRLLDLGGLAQLSEGQYQALEPVRWPIGAAQPSAAAQPFADGRFGHPDGRARLVATPPRPPAHAPDAEFPWVLNTGRLRDQWHTMTRSARAARLNRHLPVPFVDLAAEDAARLGAAPGDLVTAVTRWGRLDAPLRISGELAPGTVFVPIHWSDAFAAQARVGALVSPAADPSSGEPEFKHTPVRIERMPVDWYGFAVSRTPVRTDAFAWWARVPGEAQQRHEFAGRGRPDWPRLARALLGAPPDADWLEYRDVSAGVYRAAHLSGDRLEACLFVAPRPRLPASGWLEGLFARAELSADERQGLLNAAPFRAAVDEGPVICACFGVGRRRIEAAIGAEGCATVRQIGARLKAGTQCGSCVPELRAILAGRAGSPAAV